MLELNTEIVCNIITKAREFHAKEEVAISPEESSDYAASYDYLQLLADHQDDPTYIELKNIIDTLEPDQQEELITLLYLGRGDFDLDELSAARQQAQSIPINRRADYLIAKPLLADYLEEGLALLEYSCDV